ncbi:MAG: NAD(+)/NADH kinase, partial [Clostridia bacterium]|nr:NAD(+)/NADH kinase [Clostridia bacterium]
MKKIVIIPNNNKEAAFEIAERIAAIISKNGAIAYVDEKYGADYNKIAASYSEFPNDAELIIVVGGDGSVIDASLLAVKYDIP